MTQGETSMLIQFALVCTLIMLLEFAWGKPRAVQRVTCGLLAVLPVVGLVLMHQQIMPWGVQ